jgi:threonine synthase
MKLLGIIPRLPRLLGVQAEGARPIVDAFRSGTDLVAGGDTTIADSIAVGMPRNWRRAINEVRTSGGEMLAVTDDEILEAMRLTARLGGVFGEPAAVAGVAGLWKAIQQGIVRATDSALVVITGNGLKDIQTARTAAGKEFVIPPTVNAVETVLSTIAETQ